MPTLRQHLGNHGNYLPVDLKSAPNQHRERLGWGHSRVEESADHPDCDRAALARFVCVALQIGAATRIDAAALHGALALGDGAVLHAGDEDLLLDAAPDVAPETDHRENPRSARSVQRVKTALVADFALDVGGAGSEPVGDA
ncbi:hypothetical protein [Corynebacterium sp. H78]|uniref:hypothetical protein n=1 Tax=Corynebacterium sp. H78 TaxID=3133417 RepID=UPI00309E205E